MIGSAVYVNMVGGTVNVGIYVGVDVQVVVGAAVVGAAVVGAAVVVGA